MGYAYNLMASGNNCHFFSNLLSCTAAYSHIDLIEYKSADIVLGRHAGFDRQHDLADICRNDKIAVIDSICRTLRKPVKYHVEPNLHETQISKCISDVSAQILSLPLSLSSKRICCLEHGFLHLFYFV